MQQHRDFSRSHRLRWENLLAFLDTLAAALNGAATDPANDFNSPSLCDKLRTYD
jgi:hypothetical protein